jgi:pimeloyl-ACP methyl ester carboxylesterase
MSATRRLVLIHGFTERPSMWDSLISELNDDSIAISTPSIPGHGSHPEIPYNRTAQTYCQAIIDQLPAADLPWIVVGHSMGGYLASTLVTMAPQRIAALGFFHSKAGADNATKIEDRKRAIEAAKQNRALYLGTMLRNTLAECNMERCSEALSDMISAAQHDISSACIEAAHTVMIQRPDNVEHLRRAAYPVYYFLGRNDKSIPLDQLGDELKSLSNAQITIAENTGHMGQIEAPREALNWIKQVVIA